MMQPRPFLLEFRDSAASPTDGATPSSPLPITTSIGHLSRAKPTLLINSLADLPARTLGQVAAVSHSFHHYAERAAESACLGYDKDKYGVVAWTQLLYILEFANRISEDAVGRQHEALLLLRTIVFERHVKGICVSGPPGIGKSSLLRSLLLRTGFSHAYMHLCELNCRDLPMETLLSRFPTNPEARHIAVIDEMDGLTVCDVPTERVAHWAELVSSIVDRLRESPEGNDVTVIIAAQDEQKIHRMLCDRHRFTRIAIPHPTQEDMLRMIHAHLPQAILFDPSSILAALGDLRLTAAEIIGLCRDVSMLPLRRAMQEARRLGRPLRDIRDGAIVVSDRDPADILRDFIDAAKEMKS